MATDIVEAPEPYFEPPNSLLSMNQQTYGGLLVIGILACISVLFTSTLLAFISWRMLAWKSHYSSFIGRNQSLVLIYQLVLADFLQSLGFVVSFHWASARQIIGPSDACFVQGWLIQLGDVASAFFVLAIALHTTYQIILNRTVSHKVFVLSILGAWSFAMMLTCLAPIIGGRYVFLRAGSWCWISNEHENLRLSLHYLWIFIVQFGSIFIYTAGFYYLYRSKRSSPGTVNGTSERAIRRAAKAMLAYALVYTVLTLPLAAGRMAAMSSDSLPDAYYLFAGALFTSSGWVDTILYAITRRTLLFKELNSHDDRSARPFHRQSSTDNILGRQRRSGFNGIMMNTTVKVELDDVEGRGSPDNLGKGSYFVSAKATRK